MYVRFEEDELCYSCTNCLKRHRLLHFQVLPIDESLEKLGVIYTLLREDPSICADVVIDMEDQNIQNVPLKTKCRRIKKIGKSILRYFRRKKLISSIQGCIQVFSQVVIILSCVIMGVTIAGFCYSIG